MIREFKGEKLEKELERLRALAEMENKFHRKGVRFVFGIDEAGRGPLCGPVVAGCVVLPEECFLPYLNDSKKLSEEKREYLYDKIINVAVAYGLGSVSEKRIDEINILNATFEAMSEAFLNCAVMLKEKRGIEGPEIESSEIVGSEIINPEIERSEIGRSEIERYDIENGIVLVDGNRTVPGIRMKQEAVVKGDSVCAAISAASILAKVTRDRLMASYDKEFPQYGFSRHKGYGTAEHIAAIKKYGPCDIHRKSFIGNFYKNEV